MKQKKCFPPARMMKILGFLYDAIAKSCRLSAEKQKKYINRIDKVLGTAWVLVKNLEKLVGNLTYAAWVAPFGCPFLSVLSTKITPSMRKRSILVSGAMKNALLIWRMILKKTLDFQAV